MFGPALEAQLKPHGLTLRHFPSPSSSPPSADGSRPGRGGHFATLYTHIDDFVGKSPRGHPGRGRRIAPDARLRAQPGPAVHRVGGGARNHHRGVDAAPGSARPPRFGLVRFGDFYAAAEAVRAISQSGLNPANCRLIDAEEAGITGTNDGTASVLVLGLSRRITPRPLDGAGARMLRRPRGRGGPGGGRKWGRRPRAGAAGRWRDAFFRNPYYRAEFVRRGILQETFETAITWDRFPRISRRGHGTDAAGHPGGHRTQRNGDLPFTHVYPDGPAPYFTYHALGNRDGLVRQIEEITSAAKERVHRLGGTITHHHAVGRDHRPWYDRQRPGCSANPCGPPSGSWTPRES